MPDTYAAARCPVGYMQAGVDRYVNDGMLSSRFLRAIFSNDLAGAFSAADDQNIASMHEWVLFMLNDMPAYLQGSPEKVAAWIEIKHQERVAARVSS